MIEFKKGDIIPCEIGYQNISGHMVYLKPLMDGYRGKYVNAVKLKAELNNPLSKTKMRIKA